MMTRTAHETYEQAGIGEMHCYTYNGHDANELESLESDFLYLEQLAVSGKIRVVSRIVENWTAKSLRASICFYRLT